MIDSFEHNYLEDFMMENTASSISTDSIFDKPVSSCNFPTISAFVILVSPRHYQRYYLEIVLRDSQCFSIRHAPLSQFFLFGRYGRMRANPLYNRRAAGFITGIRMMAPMTP
jgi:hypothetical protein